MELALALPTDGKNFPRSVACRVYASIIARRAKTVVQ